MDAIELEKYEYQLSQIKLALVKDCDNIEFLNLQTELTDLIQLTKQYLQSSTQTIPQKSATTQKPPKSIHTTTPTHTFNSGDECLAKYSDNKFYPAKITSITGSAEHQLFSIRFTGYDSTEILKRSDLKPITDTRKRQLLPEPPAAEEEAEKEKKRKKLEKKKEVSQIKTAEQGVRQKSWQSFAKKGTKKGVNIPGISGSSMFSSPADLNPNAKVGVTGSGKGMTVSKTLGRQTFREGSS